MAEEAKIEKYLKKQVKRRGGIVRKVKWIGHNGAPDRLVWIKSWTKAVLVELKAPGKEAEEHQLREHKKLKKMGFLVFVINSKEGVDKLMRMAL